MENIMKAVLIYSGGLDSTVLLHEQKERIALAISFNYGSKHNDREFYFAGVNTGKLGIKHIRIDLPFIDSYFKSSLLNSGSDIPEGHYEDKSMRSTVVPFRNGIMLSIAAGIAESIGADTVMIANHKGDHAIYPDCRGEFIHQMSLAIQEGTYAGIRIVAPFTSITKRQIALIGKDLGVNFGDTYSCYKGGNIHCGKCGTCVERIEALEGFDPTTYTM